MRIVLEKMIDKNDDLAEYFRLILSHNIQTFVVLCGKNRKKNYFLISKLFLRCTNIKFEKYINCRKFLFC